jgi:hypothetical protein
MGCVTAALGIGAESPERACATARQESEDLQRIARAAGNAHIQLKNNQITYNYVIIKTKT